MIHHSRIEDCYVDMRVPLCPGFLVSRQPVFDRAHSLPSGKHLFARIDYTQALAVAEREGAELISSDLVDRLRDNGQQLMPYLGTPRAENDIAHSIRHDADVQRQLEELRKTGDWTELEPVAGAGKHWIAGAPKGRSRLKGWDKDGGGPGLTWWQPDQVAHNRFHFDDGTTTMLVWRVPATESPIVGTVDEPRYVPAQRTPAPVADVLAALQRAWPGGSRESLLVLLAQWGIETGDGRSCWNWNLGNVKRVKGEDWTMLSNVWEILSGRKVVFQPPHAQTHFAAFDDVDRGAAFFLAKLQGRFAKAWHAVLAGDPGMFARELKKLGYYTADVKAYTYAIEARYRQFDATTRDDDAPTHLEMLALLGYETVKSFQRAYPSLVVDGIVGPKTRAAIELAWSTRDEAEAA